MHGWYTGCLVLVMKPFLVVFATREGYTRRIAEHVGARIVARGRLVEVHEVGTLAEPFDVYQYGGAIIAASIHGGRHEPEMVTFVKRHRCALEQVPAAFLSVSLREASVEHLRRSDARRERADRAVHKRIAAFLRATDWHPNRVEPVAGALLYTRHGPVARLAMMLRARHRGTSTNTSRDHEYTDWPALDRFVDELVVQTTGWPTAGESGVMLLG
jgi:menaquinone-dependent protoporphyrinogen oxidase